MELFSKNLIFALLTLVSGVCLFAQDTQLQKPNGAIAIARNFSDQGSGSYSGNLSSWADVYVVPFRPDSLEMGDKFIDASGDKFTIISFGSYINGQMSVVLQYDGGPPYRRPLGRGVVYEDSDRGLIPVLPSANGQLTQFLQARIIASNFANLNSVPNGQVDTLQSVSDTTLLVDATEGDYALIGQDTFAVRDAERWIVRANGPQGIPGIDGNTIYNGIGTPSDTLGMAGDFYIDIENDPILYGPKIGGSWPPPTSLVGPPGPQGAPGSGVVIVGTVSNASALPIPYTGDVGDMFITEDQGNGYVWGGSSWTFVGPIRGPQGNDGNDGQAATIVIGTVTTGAPGSSAQVTNSGDQTAAVINFVIPRGDTGLPGADGDDGDDGLGWTSGSYNPSTGVVTFFSNDGLTFSTADLRGDDGQDGSNGQDGTNGSDGQSATVTVGTTTTSAPGTNASATNVGTTQDAIINFVIPRGDPGAPGNDGNDGSDGVDGLGWTSGSYNPSTGVVTFLSDDGLTFSTGDLRGVDGSDGINGTNGIDGEDGDGFTGGTYNPTTGIVEFLSDDGLGFSTDDLRGQDGNPGNDGVDGQDGDDGLAATIAIGTVTTLPPGSNATATNSGTPNAAIIDLGIPEGQPGSGSTDDQQLTWNQGTRTLGIEDGNTVNILGDGTGTDDQDATEVLLNPNIVGFNNVQNIVQTSWDKIAPIDNDIFQGGLLSVDYNTIILPGQSENLYDGNGASTLNSPSPLDHLIEVYKNNNNIFQFAYERINFGGASGVYFRTSTDNGSNWRPWSELTNSWGTTTTATLSSDLNTWAEMGIAKSPFDNTAPNAPNTSNDWVIENITGPSSNRGSQFAYPFGGGDDFYFRSQIGTGATWGNWGQVWTSETDGIGSGLDAALLQGLTPNSLLSASFDNDTRILSFDEGGNVSIPGQDEARGYTWLPPSASPGARQIYQLYGAEGSELFTNNATGAYKLELPLTSNDNTRVEIHIRHMPEFNEALTESGVFVIGGYLQSFQSSFERPYAYVIGDANCRLDQLYTWRYAQDNGPVFYIGEDDTNWSGARSWRVEKILLWKDNSSQPTQYKEGYVASISTDAALAPRTFSLQKAALGRDNEITASQVTLYDIPGAVFVQNANQDNRYLKVRVPTDNKQQDDVRFVMEIVANGRFGHVRGSCRIEYNYDPGVGPFDFTVYHYRGEGTWNLPVRASTVDRDSEHYLFFGDGTNDWDDTSIKITYLSASCPQFYELDFDDYTSGWELSLVTTIDEPIAGNTYDPDVHDLTLIGNELTLGGDDPIDLSGIQGAGDNLGNHIMTQALITNNQNIAFDATLEDRIYLGQQQIIFETGDATGGTDNRFEMVEGGLSFAQRTTEPPTFYRDLLWKQAVNDGDYVIDRLMLDVDEVYPSGGTFDEADRVIVLTDQDVFSRVLQSDFQNTTADPEAIVTGLTLDGIHRGKYRVRMSLYVNKQSASSTAFLRIGLLAASVSSDSRWVIVGGGQFSQARNFGITTSTDPLPSTSRQLIEIEGYIEFANEDNDLRLNFGADVSSGANDIVNIYEGSSITLERLQN